VLRKKNGDKPTTASSPSGIVWTTVWSDAAAASTIARRLTNLHGGVLKSNDNLFAMTSTKDGEAIWLEQRGNVVCFVKNLAPEIAGPLAHAALYTRDERRFETLRTLSLKPRSLRLGMP
jgi:hypothetical protein